MVDRFRLYVFSVGQEGPRVDAAGGSRPEQGGTHEDYRSRPGAWWCHGEFRRRTPSHRSRNRSRGPRTRRGPDPCRGGRRLPLRPFGHQRNAPAPPADGAGSRGLGFRRGGWRRGRRPCARRPRCLHLRARLRPLHPLCGRPPGPLRTRGAPSWRRRTDDRRPAPVHGRHAREPSRGRFRLRLPRRSVPAIAGQGRGGRGPSPFGPVLLRHAHRRRRGLQHGPHQAGLQGRCRRAWRRRPLRHSRSGGFGCRADRRHRPLCLQARDRTAHGRDGCRHGGRKHGRGRS